ncbi:nuclear transport factor 2 domain protein [Mycolicibacterium hassiacum DSM 44199]|uniref:Nuclear transport factor 2 domain protein n=1 Tax=Mycolicibacterium hassiacum (strain DSM 44199 / CIP 105218 / JCM 12690 / 3849) TaxID=1122247 RepID=K5BCH2_MYCHD|nr:nuclear transport factor 2 domain protein [Mycolicibacterium hassiacum DSM 44199]
MNLFSADGRIEDPVGSRPHVGRAAICRFYDTFIGPRQVTYHPDVDVVMGSTAVRDGELEIVMGSVRLDVPVYIRYDIGSDDGGAEPRITALSAYWELPAMIGRFLRTGVGALPAGLQLARSLLANLGPVGALGFVGGLRGTWPQGKRRLETFLADARAGNEIAVHRLLAKGCRITLGDDQPMPTAELIARIAATRPRKVIASGFHLVAGLQQTDRRDILFAEVDPKPFAIKRIRYFTDHT